MFPPPLCARLLPRPARPTHRHEFCTTGFQGPILLMHAAGPAVPADRKHAAVTGAAAECPMPCALSQKAPCAEPRFPVPPPARKRNGDDGGSPSALVPVLPSRRHGAFQGISSVKAPASAAVTAPVLRLRASDTGKTLRSCSIKHGSAAPGSRQRRCGLSASEQTGGRRLVTALPRAMTAACAAEP